MSFWIPFIIILAAFIVIIFIITKKFPTLASIDTEAIPWDREQRLKKALLANRLSRKLAERGRSALLIVLPIWNIIKRSAVSLFRKIRELETHYRLSRKAGHLPDSPNPAEEDILIKARKYIEDGEFQLRRFFPGKIYSSNILLNPTSSFQLFRLVLEDYRNHFL